LLFRLFGRLHWDPPPYLQGTGARIAAPFRRLAAWRRSDSRAFWSTTFGLLLLLVAAAVSIQWYLSRPEPQTVSVTLHEPGPTPLKEDAEIPPLLVAFGDSAARLADIGKPVRAGIVLEPAIAGTWTWVDDQNLRFDPEADWPVARAYTLRFERELFPDHVLLESYQHGFSSARFEMTIEDTAFHQDPTDPGEKLVVATLSFTHPVEPKSLESRVEMRLTGDPDALPGGREQAYGVSVTYDEFLGRAYLRSERLPIPPDDATMELEIAEGVRSERGGNAAGELASRTTVPGMFAYFRIEDAQLSLVRDERNEPEQVLIVSTSVDVLGSEIAKHIEAFVLPKDRPAAPGRRAQRNFRWGDPTAVGPEVLATAQPLALDPVPTERDHAKLHSFRIDAEPERFVYVRIQRGVRSYGGYVLAREYDQIRRIPEYPREIQILHEGSVLSLTGEKKLSVLARGVDALRVSIGQVLPGRVNHLVSQSQGSLANPTFRQFGEEDLADFSREIRRLEPAPPAEARYTALDFTGAMSRGGPRRGLFFLRVEGWDEEKERARGPSDRRLLLITDLGVLVKENRDGSRDVFVQSIASGSPVPGARVEVLGRNGLPIASRTTDPSGHAKLSSLKDFEHEKSPVVYVVRKDDDLSFLPYARRDRALELSRFDIGGIRTPETGDRLRAYLFSDRGIYRPGDTVHAGLVVRSSVWRKDTAGVPLELTITDPRGRRISTRKLEVPAYGFDEIEFETLPTSPTGQYTIAVHIVKDGRRGSLLGSTAVRVEEFLPDRMRITARLEPFRRQGWVSPESLRARVRLENLYGTPASERRISARLYLSPGVPRLPGFSDYRFADPLRAEKSFQERVEDATTDDGGEAGFELDLARFADATYWLRFEAEGFEADGGRSVVAESSVLVSPLQHLVGYKADGDLAYVHRGSPRAVELIAVDPSGAQTAVADLEAQLVELRYVSVLTKQPNGTYRYESKRKEIPVDARPLALPATGRSYALPTDRAGDFALVIRDAAETELNRIPFSVIGAGNLTRELEKNAELRLNLDKPDYEPGDEIELEIKAPYTGAGLITIEADRVYAHRWFSSDTTASVQRIRVPSDLEGNGYVVVSFVRAPDSDEIFMSPLSSAAAPFSVSRAGQTVEVEVDAPELARPGEPFEIGFRTDRPSRLALFAVDEGILQVARYQTPDPLGFFFQKRALEVQTLQILDLILPEFSLAEAAFAPGGGDKALLGSNLNPFRRRSQEPAVYWSGIVDAGPQRRTLRYTAPDYFNGTLRIMAVAVAADAVGATERQSVLRGHFSLSPNVPTFVAPGDRFEVSVTVANNVEGSGQEAPCHVSLEVPAGLELVGDGAREIAISEGREKTASFELRAQQELGPAELRFAARTQDKRSKYDIELSVRPATPYRVTTRSGHFRDGSAEVVVGRRLHPQFRELEVAASVLPLGLAGGLVSYLNHYPYGCTEQLVSRGIPALALLRHPELGPGREQAREQIDHTMRVLQSRQNGDGAFGFWAANSHVSEFQTAYALQFLIEARDRGQAVPDELLGSALGWAEKFAQEKRRTLPELRTQAQAIYLLTRSGRVTTKWLTPLRERLEERFEKQWRGDLAAAYLAASYELLQQSGEAGALIRRVEIQGDVEEDYGEFYDALVRNSQLLVLLSRHFPERLADLDGEALARWVEPVTLGHYNSVSSAYTILAMASYAEAAGDLPPSALAFEARRPGAAYQPLVPQGRLFSRAVFPPDAEKLRISSDSERHVFHQVLEAGFDVALPTDVVVEGLEVAREYRNTAGDVVSSAALGEELEVHLKIRGIGDAPIQNVAVVDLLPGGFEIVRTPGLREGTTPGSDWRIEYADVREDRLLVFGTAEAAVRTFVYTIKATNVGRYVMPPPFAESMYDRRLQAQGAGGEIAVQPAP
jgi:uncharacterized protein YfaS (alpha-2-macroglobulin family)